MSWWMGWAPGLLLGSLILAGCGDGIPPPSDASRPRDASQPRDASRPHDASPSRDARRPLDAGRPLDASPSRDAGRPLDAAPVDAAAFHCDSFPDSLEPNDSADTARIPQLDYFFSGSYASWSFRACTDHRNEDWYLFPSETLGWDRNGDLTDVTMRIYFFARDTGSCGGVAYCDGQRLPSGPENTVSVEVYRVSTMEILRAETSEFGVVWLNGYGETFTHDFLIRISGPPEALYDYRMSVHVSLTDSEDECEC